MDVSADGLPVTAYATTSQSFAGSGVGNARARQVTAPTHERRFIAASSSISGGHGYSIPSAGPTRRPCGRRREPRQRSRSTA